MAKKTGLKVRAIVVFLGFLELLALAKCQNDFKFRLVGTMVAAQDIALNSETDSYSFLQANGYHTVTENAEERAKSGKDPKALRDFVINTRLYEHTSFNARSVYVTIDTVDISRQSLNSEGYVQLEGVRVNYACYSAGLALGRQISSVEVT